jgi:hypothetical protein
VAGFVYQNKSPNRLEFGGVSLDPDLFRQFQTTIEVKRSTDPRTGATNLGSYGLLMPNWNNSALFVAPQLNEGGFF